MVSIASGGGLGINGLSHRYYPRNGKKQTPNEDAVYREQVTSGETYPNGYYRVVPYFGVAALFGGLFSAWSWALQYFLLLGLALFVSLVGVVGLFACGVVGKSVERSLVFFREGDSVARWEVEGQQWLDFKRAKRANFTKHLRGVLIVVAATLCVVGVFAYDEPFVLLIFSGVISTTAACLLPIFWAGSVRPYAAGVTRAVIEVGPSAVLLNGKLLPFAGFGQILTGVEIDEEKRVLTIRGMASTSEGAVPVELELPYPSEAREQALRVMLALSIAYGLLPADDEDLQTMEEPEGRRET